MILLLEYLLSLGATFVISAAIFCTILSATVANKAPAHSHQSHAAQLNKHESTKLRSSSRVLKDKSTSVVADAGHLPEAAFGCATSATVTTPSCKPEN